MLPRYVCRVARCFSVADRPLATRKYLLLPRAERIRGCNRLVDRTAKEFFLGRGGNLVSGELQNGAFTFLVRFYVIAAQPRS